MVRVLRNPAVVGLILAAAQTAVAQQHRVDPRNMDERVVAVVPWTGTGTKADPKRAIFAPTPSQLSPTSRSGILASQCIPNHNAPLALSDLPPTDPPPLTP